MPFPKDPPIIDPWVGKWLVYLSPRCEWPNGCRAKPTDAAHIRARGHGGGRRKDTLDDLVALCRDHHDEYDHRMGQSRKNQRWMKQAVARRPSWVVHAVREFLGR